MYRRIAQLLGGPFAAPVFMFSILRFKDLGSDVLNLAAGYFIGSAGGFTAFPLFNWFRPEGFLSETHHYYFMTTIDAVFCLICIYGVLGLCNSE